MQTQRHDLVIIGGGLGGLTLARTLAQHDLSCVVLERDAAPRARTQGGMLDIHADSGQRALEAAGLTAEFRSRIHQGGEATRVRDVSGALRWDEADDAEGDRPEIDRGVLREMLVESLPAGTVRWNAQVVEVTEAGDGDHTVRLVDGTTLTTPLLVGADGAHSRVRRMLSDAVPEYSGISFIELDLLDAGRRHPAEKQVVGDGMFFGLGRDRGFLAHAEPDGSLHVYVALRVPEGWVDALPDDDPESLRGLVLAEFDGWDDSLRHLVSEADGRFVPRKIMQLPLPYGWDRRPGVTMLGDAAHLMSPFAGEGANLALADGADLALALLAGPDDRDTALRDYEETMLARANRSGAESATSMALLFEEDAVDQLVAMFSGAGAPA